MHHEITHSAFGLKLRPIELEDAGFILELRRNPSINLFVGDTPLDIKSQESWIREYFKRKGDYYFCFERARSGKPLGTAGIYNLKCQEGIKVAEWGRWLLSPGVLAAPASFYLIFQTAFEKLNLDQVNSRTVLDNVQLISFFDRLGLENCGIKKNDVVLRGIPKDQVIYRLTKSLWESIKPDLIAVASKAERFVNGD